MADWVTMYGEAKTLAKEFVPVCKKVRIAGSIRRGKEKPNDVELVVVDPSPAAYGLVDGWLNSERATLRRKSNGHKVAYGLKYRAICVGETKVDLFFTTAAQFGLIFLLRTGPGDLNRTLVTSVAAGGMLPNTLRVKDGWLWRGREKLPTRTEVDVYRAIGLPYFAPFMRNEREYWKWFRRGQAGLKKLMEEKRPVFYDPYWWPVVGGTMPNESVYCRSGDWWAPRSERVYLRSAVANQSVWTGNVSAETIKRYVEAQKGL